MVCARLRRLLEPIGETARLESIYGLRSSLTACDMAA